MRVCVSKVKRCVYLLNMNEIFGIFMKLSKKKTTCLFFRFLWSQTILVVASNVIVYIILCIKQNHIEI